MTIAGAIAKARKDGTPYLMRQQSNGKTCLLKIMDDGSFGSCYYPNGDSHCEHSFDVSELAARNWRAGIWV
jgi:hypothetical protein